MALVKILETEFELNMFDADIAQRVHTAVEQAQETMDCIAKGRDKAHHEIIRESCQCVFECMNRIFGEGADKAIFGAKTDLLQCVDAMGQLVAAVGVTQEKELEAHLQKYLPNRQTRRTNK